ncbi:MAG: hypothetical protein ACREIF_04615 [Chthoniobacterales bacterium]
MCPSNTLVPAKAELDGSPGLAMKGKNLFIGKKAKLTMYDYF